MIQSEPIFDQHISFISKLPSSVWLLPLGVFAVGLRFKEAISEYADLVFSLVLNIIKSIMGMLYRYYVLGPVKRALLIFIIFDKT